MSKRRTHSPEFKARVAMEAISGRKTLQEIAADHSIHPIQVSQWKKQLLEGSSELFTRGNKTQSNDEGQAKEAELFQQIGKLQMELEWLKKISAALTPMKEENWSIQTTGSSRLATNVSCLDWPDPPATTNQFLSVTPLLRSWPGSMPSTWRIPPVVAAELFTIWLEMVFR
jgi:transposase-like protein